MMESFGVDAAQQPTEDPDDLVSTERHDLRSLRRHAKALKAVDAAATVRFDLAERRVDIQSGKADSAELSAAIRQAGYTPVQVEGVGGSNGLDIAAARKACCCS